MGWIVGLQNGHQLTFLLVRRHGITFYYGIMINQPKVFVVSTLRREVPSFVRAISESPADTNLFPKMSAKLKLSLDPADE